MDYRNAWEILLTLAADYAPKTMPWADPAADEQTNDETAKRWVAMLTKYDEDAVTVAIAEFQRNSPGWPPTFVELRLAIEGVQHRQRPVDRSLPSPDKVAPIAHGVRVALDAYRRSGGVGTFGQWAEDALAKFDEDGDEAGFLKYGEWLKR